MAPWPTTMWCPNQTSAVLRWHGCANTRTFVTPMGGRRTKEWIVFWEDQSLSFFRESRQRRLYLESQGYWAWTEDGGVHLSHSCCPARGIARHDCTLKLMAVSPGLGLWWFLWQGDQRLIIVTALVYSSRQKLERALRAM